MKSLNFKTIALALLLIFGGSEIASAQGLTVRSLEENTEFFGKPKKKKKKKKDTKKDKEADEEGEDDEDKLTFKQRLWYGGGVNLGFSGYLGQSVFFFGLSPMVGYKFWGPFSVGPRVGFSFASYKTQGFKAASIFDWETGLFVRSKIWGPIFAHAELSNQWQQIPIGYNGDGKLVKETDDRVNQYLGLGFNNGDGEVGYDISILYNFAVAREINTDENPFNFRLGFTWRF